MNIRCFYFIILCLAIVYSNAMEQETKNCNEYTFTKISSMNSITEFANQIVAYKILNNHFESKSGHMISSDPSVKYGWIAKQNDVYELKRLINQGECALTYRIDAETIEDEIYIRHVTYDEVCSILAVIDKGEAHFEYTSDYAKAKMLCVHNE